jgi:inner membrane protein
MDNLCHTLTGAALGKAGLADKTPYGMVTLMVAANLPDVDVAVFLTDTLPMSFRRGWTHGVLEQITLPIALAAVMYALARARTHPHPAPARTHPHPSAPPAPRYRTFLLLSYVGVLSHVFMDWLNSYGVRLLMPFSDRWFYGDALYIVDPWLYLVFGAGIWLARRAARRGAPDPSRPARVALGLAAVYMLVMLASNQWARAVVRDGLTRAGRPADTRFMVTPVFVNPIRREVLVDTGDRYEKGFVWFDPVPRFRPAGYGVDKGLTSPEALAGLASPRAQAYLRWSRFPFVVVDRTQAPPRLRLNDYRYSDAGARLGWAGMTLEIGE